MTGFRIRLQRNVWTGETWYVIDELVTSSGLYITWEGIYSTQEAAVAEARRVLQIGVSGEN